MQNDKQLNPYNVPEISIVILCYKEGNFVRDFVSRVINLLDANKIFNYELVLVGNYYKDTNNQQSIINANKFNL